jgi:hypothetical protein
MILESNRSGIMDLRGIRFFANAINGDFVANEKMILLLALLILWVQIIALEKWCLSGINFVSDGLHSQKQCIIIPSVGGSSSKQGYCFFICLVRGFDCVCGKVDAIDFNQRLYLILIKVVLWTCMASAFSQMQLLGILWQIKNDTLAGLFDFVGADHYFFGVFNLAIKVVSDGLYSQKQCIIIPSASGQ